MKNIHIVGAFDRHNYGDILFPVIQSKIISKENPYANISYYSITSRDLTAQGGVKTKEIRGLINEAKERDVIIMSGGDILGADWPVMIGNNIHPAFFIPILLIRKVLGIKTANDIFRILSKQANEFPYIISRADAAAAIYYCCVGGAGLKEKNKYHINRVAESLLNSDGVSVRDSTTQKLLSKMGVNARLVPDSALVMSDIFTKDELSKRAWSKKIRKSMNFEISNYLVFQGSKIHITRKLTSIESQLQEISESSNLSILFLPIGRAAGHEDQVPLEKLFQSLSKKGIPCAIQDSDHVTDIMASIAFSKAYIGTSLHGAITAYSFGHKVCGIMTSKVKKLSSFLSTWMTPGDYATIEHAEFKETFKKLTKDKYSISNTHSLKSQKELIYKEISSYPTK